MGLRFFKRKRIFPGLTLNISKSGVSLSIGIKGAKITIGRRGIRKTIGIPGTGLYYTTLHKYNKRRGADGETVKGDK